MEAALDGQLAAALARSAQGLRHGFRVLSRPAALRRLQLAVIILLCLWILVSVSRAIWSLVPIPPAIGTDPSINPIVPAQRPAAGTSVDLQTLLDAHLFGQPGDLSVVLDGLEDAPAGDMTESEAAVALAGIENGAPESRLPLTLRGIVASSEAGLGQAVIEKSGNQGLYQVGDELPVNGEVTLAKVLPNQVVLDNAGRYELLTLFEATTLAVAETAARPTALNAAAAPPRSGTAGSAGSPRRVAVGSGAAELAQQYRQQMYDNPQALADLVRVSPMRENGALTGYRVMPGKAAREFSRLGFQSGDVVTAINGVSLNDPMNIQRLYRDMRTATAASFELVRKGEMIVLDVDIAGAGSN